jgi:hypothetical protein
MRCENRFVIAARRPSSVEGRFLIPSSDAANDDADSGVGEGLEGLESSAYRRIWSLHWTHIDARTEGRLDARRDREVEEGIKPDTSLGANQASRCMAKP